MWPWAQGSLQAIEASPVVQLKSYSLSAPQLSIINPTPPVSRAIPDIRGIRKPLPPWKVNSLLPRLDPSTLAEPPAQDGIRMITDCLPEEILPCNRNIVAVLLYSIFRWAQRHDFDTKQTLTLLSLYCDMTMYATDSPWRTHAQLYDFMKQSVLNCCVLRPPASARVFTADQARDILLLFCHRHLSSLPLLRQTALPNIRLTLCWACSTEETQIDVQMF